MSRYLDSCGPISKEEFRSKTEENRNTFIAKVKEAVEGVTKGGAILLEKYEALKMREQELLAVNAAIKERERELCVKNEALELEIDRANAERVEAEKIRDKSRNCVVRMRQGRFKEQNTLKKALSDLFKKSHPKFINFVGNQLEKTARKTSQEKELASSIESKKTSEAGVASAMEDLAKAKSKLERLVKIQSEGYPCGSPPYSPSSPSSSSDSSLENYSEENIEMLRKEAEQNVKEMEELLEHQKSQVKWWESQIRFLEDTFDLEKDLDEIAAPSPSMSSDDDDDDGDDTSAFGEK